MRIDKFFKHWRNYCLTIFFYESGKRLLCQFSSSMWFFAYKSWKARSMKRQEHIRGRKTNIVEGVFVRVMIGFKFSINLNVREGVVSYSFPSMILFHLVIMDWQGSLDCLTSLFAFSSRLLCFVIIFSLPFLPPPHVLSPSSGLLAQDGMVRSKKWNSLSPPYRRHICKKNKVFLLKFIFTPRFYIIFKRLTVPLSFSIWYGLRPNERGIYGLA